MRLLLDIQATQSLDHSERGIARFVAEHARGLLAAGADVAMLALNPSLPFPGGLHPDLLASPLLQWNTKANVDALDGDLVYFVMSPFEGIRPSTVLPPYISRRGLPLVTTLYDLIPLVLQDLYFHGSRRRVYRQRLDLLLQSDLVLAISEHTRRDGIEHYGVRAARIAVVNGGVSPFFQPPDERDHPDLVVHRALPEITRPFVLSVGGGDSRKNLDGLLRGWACVPEPVRRSHQLVVACRLSLPVLEVLDGIRAELGLKPDEVVFTGFVADELLRALYQSARLFVFPSTYEGFGLPLVEAVACDCPGLSSNTTSLPEILEWPASTFDPTDPVDMGERITAVLTDPIFRQALVDRGRQRRLRFTWDEVARKTLAALKRLPARAPASVQVRGQRPRIALFSPMPPAVSGLAVYDERLLAELSALAEVTVFDPVREAPGTALPGGVAHEPVQSMGTTFSPWAFDHLVYVLGNSRHHARSLEALLRYPGVVWLHDTRLPGVYNGLAEYTRDPEQYMHDRLNELYPGRLPHLTRAQLRLQGDLSQKGLGMTGRIVGQASRLILNSHLAARLLALDQPPGFDLRPIEILRHADPPVPEHIGPPPWPGEGPLIVALGVVDPVKAPTLLLAAFARLCATRPARLAFVGPCGEDLQDLIASNVDRLGLADRVIVTDVVDEATYWAWTAGADLGVQLRTTTYGESSGGVHELVAAGVPCITSVAACTEMPEGVVGMVAPDVTAPQLADAMFSLLGDHERRAAMVTAGVADAEDHSFGWLARRLVDVLAGAGAS